jgi:uncharacterized membrane protein
MEEAETVETTEKESKGLKAKTASLCAKILGAVIIVAGHVLKWAGVFPDASSTEICACGFSVMGIFGTVDLNIMLDKFTGGNRCVGEN